MLRVEGFPDYFIFSDGRVFSEKSNKFLKIIKHSTGYDMVRLTSPEGQVKNFRFHRLLAQAFIPNPENKEYVNHIDGDKRNNSLDNLEWVTHQENEDHATLAGLKNMRGVKNPACKFTREDVEEMINLLKSGLKIKEVAVVFNCSHTTVPRLINIEFPGVLDKYNGTWNKRKINKI